MKLPFFYFVSFEIYSPSGDLKSKCWRSIYRQQKISDSDDFSSFENAIREANNISKKDQIHWLSVNLLNP